MSAAEGRFVWFDLVTTDAAAAKRFYGEIAGWGTTPFTGADYEMWTAGGVPLGGVSVQAGTGPRWIGFVAHRDVDAAIGRAEKMGGKVIEPPMQIPGGGRFAILADPQGARFGIYTPAAAEEVVVPDRTKAGQFSWAELQTTDWKAARGFYGELFGWQESSCFDMGPAMGSYFVFGTDPKDGLGGMFDAARVSQLPPFWLHYVQVKSADASAKRIAELGGTILHGPADIPGGGRIAQCLDPQGAAFAVVSDS
ncbi:VOC family protein [Vulgatibacter sp.]|uniref:VOC family protein n=1 Tax=Vulgatibacter sp. TaxID=1971226 RepID=UPI0035626759